jgi:hypothetical protein
MQPLRIKLSALSIGAATLTPKLQPIGIHGRTLWWHVSYALEAIDGLGCSLLLTKKARRRSLSLPKDIYQTMLIQTCDSSFWSRYAQN